MATKPKEAPVGREIYADEKSAFHDDDGTEGLVDSLVDEEKAFAESAKGDNPDPQGHIWLDKLRAPLPKDKIKYREEKWGEVAYVEWHTVADILDQELGGNWNFEITKLTIGNKVAVTEATLSVCLGEGDNRLWVNRSGVGVGEIHGESSGSFDTAIKASASDALKRCAVMYGIGRDLYTDPPAQEKPSRDADFFRDNTDNRGARTEEYPPPTRSKAPQRGNFGPPKNPNEPISEKQVGLLRVLGRKAGCDVDGECAHKYDKDLIDLTKGEASEFIGYMQEMAGE